MGRSVEIRLLGGLASIKMGQQNEHALQLEVPGAKPLVQIDELSRLKQLLDEGLIDNDEFMQLKKEVLDKNRTALPSSSVAIEQLPEALPLSEAVPDADTISRNVSATSEPVNSPRS